MAFPTSNIPSAFFTRNAGDAAAARVHLFQKMESMNQRLPWMGLAGGATPITFHGLEHEDAEKFVAVFQDCALTNQWTSGQALAALPYFLREPARTAFDLARDRRLDAWTTTMDAARKEVSDQTRALDALQLRSGDLAISFDDLSSQMLAAVTPPAATVTTLSP